jgi:hypothetical protein
MEKNSRAFFRVFTTPTKNITFVAATFLTSMILIFFQIIIILGVSQFYFKINFLQSFWVLFISLAFIMTFFIVLGMLIGYIFNTEEMAMLAAVSLGTLFLLTSGIIFPLESMPPYLIEKAKFNPMVMSSELFKKALLFNADFASARQPLGYLLLGSMIVLAVILLIRKAEKLQFILQKPSRMKIKKDYLTNQFDFGERKAKTLAEFIVSLQNMSQEKYQLLIGQSAPRDWLMLVYKNKYLARKVEKITSKPELIKALVEELKKISEHK